MSDIKPSEVFDILKKQLSGMEDSLKLEEVGTVLQVSDGVARIYGLDNVQSNELIEFETGMMGVVLNLEEDNVGAVLFGPTDEIKEGFSVKRTGRIASIMAGEGLLGRVVDTLGNPVDGKGPIEGKLYEMPLERKAPGVIYRQPVTEPLQTGIKAIDSQIPIGRGQRELIIGDRQTGKTAIAIDTIINQKEAFDKGEPVYCIYVGVGQKVLLLHNWLIPLRNTAQWHIQLLLLLQPVNWHRFSILHHIQVVQSVKNGWKTVKTYWLSMMT
jgi:F-type H+-transporting ATPase subunit alpha